MIKRRILIRFLILLAAVVAVVLAALIAGRKMESISCGNFMSSIGCAARFWAADHDGRLPSDLHSMSNELIVTKMLICPSDYARQPATNWVSFTPAQSSYEIVTPGLKDGDANGVFLRCKIHGHLGYADATVFDGVRRRTKIP